MTEKQTIQNLDELIGLLPRQIHGIADAAQYNARRKTAEKEITEKYQQYQDDLARVKKNDDVSRFELQSAFADEIKKFQKTVEDLIKARARVLHEPRPGQTGSPATFKIGNLYLQPASAEARAFNKKVLKFAEDHNQELKTASAGLYRALLAGMDTDANRLAVNLALEKIRASDAGFAVRFSALEIERIKLIAK